MFFVITLTATSTGTVTNNCSYNLVWKNSAQSYSQTSGVSATVPEYSFKLEVSTNDGSTWSPVTLASGLKDTTGKPTTLTSITNQYNFPSMSANAYVTLINNVSVASTAGVSKSVKYRITTHWYNNTLDQNNHASKVYGGTLEFSNLKSSISD